MKALLTITICVLAYTLSFSQVDCEPYVPTEEGTKWEITNYNAKGKETGKIAYELLEKTEENGGITFVINAITFDKKGEKTFETKYNAYCKEGRFNFDMTFKMDAAQLEAYQNMDINIDASEFEVPTWDVAEGTTLEDGSLIVDITGGIVLRMTVNITDRIVEAKEEKQTPAGSFKCIRLSQNVSTKLLFNVNASSMEWYSENIGMVRSESYNKKGKMMGYSELTSLSN